MGIVIVGIFIIGMIRLLSGLRLLGESELDFNNNYMSAYRWLRNTIIFFVIDISLSLFNAIQTALSLFLTPGPIAVIYAALAGSVLLTFICGMVFIVKYTQSLKDIAIDTGEANYRYGATLLVFLIVTGILLLLINHSYNPLSYQISQVSSWFGLLSDGFYIINIIALYFCYTATSKSLDRINVNFSARLPDKT